MKCKWIFEARFEDVVTAMGELRTGCPIAASLDVIGDRWTLLILRDVLLGGVRRFSEFAVAEGIATKVHSERLERLTREGLITVNKDPSDGRRKLYAPTEAGIALIPPPCRRGLGTRLHGGDRRRKKPRGADARGPGRRDHRPHPARSGWPGSVDFGGAHLGVPRGRAPSSAKAGRRSHSTRSKLRSRSRSRLPLPLPGTMAAMQAVLVLEALRASTGVAVGPSEVRLADADSKTTSGVARTDRQRFVKSGPLAFLTRTAR